MATPSILAATWRAGLYLIEGEVRRELADRSVHALAPDGRGGALAIADRRTLWRRTARGEWQAIATAETDLSCCLAVGDAIYAGTDDARFLRVTAGGLQALEGFERTPGRERWYAGSAVIDGRRVGPPLGIRSLTATCDGAVLLANVHVGGIPRSTDGGLTWHPTIDIDCDVHQVWAHPARPDSVVAASAVGLAVSRDAGASWIIDAEGLHARYCSAVAFLGDDILIAASTDHFAVEGALYRRPLDGGRLELIAGLPRRIERIVDTGCIAVRGAQVAILDGGGNLHLSTDGGRAWSQRPLGLPFPSGVLLPG